jgi:crotonobetainyl-CoA:carnitine CoA-transferase CaiB-like acyl-CoA transferase
MTPQTALAQIWAETGLDPSIPAAAILTGEGPGLPSSFHVGTAAVATIAASGLAATTLWRLRCGRQQTVSVDLRHACAEYRSERYLKLGNSDAPARRDRLSSLYPTADGWVRLHMNFPHHREGVLHLLNCPPDPDAVAAALRHWTSVDFETAAVAAGCAVTALRSFAEWDAHPQGQATPTRPLISITRIGDAPPEPLPNAPRPLGGVRVLELVRVIAGPLAGRTLAAHGAEMLNITGALLPSDVVADLARGKLSAQLDLKSPEGQTKLADLIRGADVFVQGYRPGAIAAQGFSTLQTTALRPGIVHASLSAYGSLGPWSGRRGFDSLVQTASGFNAAEAEAAGTTKPQALPAQALDHATGYLLATGIMAALHRRATEGGSWHVEVSLARTGHWLRQLGRLAHGLAAPDQAASDVADLLDTTPSGFGAMQAIRHSAILSETPTRWDRPSVPLGTHQAVWPT